ncbi:MAG: hypothetical protein ACRC33_28650, partial [Gemmataceae bacterium]
MVVLLVVGRLLPGRLVGTRRPSHQSAGRHLISARQSPATSSAEQHPDSSAPPVPDPARTDPRTTASALLA